MTGPIIESSTERLDTFAKFKSPKTKEDVIGMLGDQTGKVHSVFRENGGSEFIKTVAVGKRKMSCLFFVCFCKGFLLTSERFCRYFRLQRADMELVCGQSENKQTIVCAAIDFKLEKVLFDEVQTRRFYRFFYCFCGTFIYLVTNCKICYIILINFN